MEYGRAPESDQGARQWLGKYEKSSATSSMARDPNRRTSTSSTRRIASSRARDAGDQGATWMPLVAAGRGRLSGVAGARWDTAGALSLRCWRAEFQKHSRLFAVVESMDNGQSIRETRDIDIPLVARHFYHHAGWAQLLESEFPGCKGVGVVGQIIPWNFPLLMLAWKVAPALASGSTVVLKPAEFTPLSALLFCEVVREIGLPPGVLNIINGDGRTGAALVDHPDVDKIAFTGSTEVGRIIRKATAGSGKKLSLELGGKSPFIVYDDADLDGVVEGVVDAIWFNQGQVCCAARDCSFRKALPTA